MGQSFVSLIRRIFWVALGFFLIFFSVNNRAPVELRFDPFAFTVPAVPAYMLLFAGIFIGLILAATVTGWLRLKGFTKRRKAERRAGFLEEQVSSLSEDVHRSQADKAHQTATLPTDGKAG